MACALARERARLFFRTGRTPGNLKQRCGYVQARLVR